MKLSWIGRSCKDIMYKQGSSFSRWPEPHYTVYIQYFDRAITKDSVIYGVYNIYGSGQPYS